MKKPSIKLRITLWYTIILSIISVLIIFAMTRISYGLLMAESKHKIEQTVTEFARMIPMQRRDSHQMPKFNFFDRGVHIALFDDNGEIVGGFMPYEFADEIVFKNDKLLESTYNNEKFLVYSKKAVAHNGKDVSVVGVISVTEKKNILNNIHKVLMGFILIIILIIAIGGYFIICRALRPIDKITKTAKSISNSNNLSQRIMLGKGNDEMYRLADAFDKMLDKIEASFEKEKQFTSDASHELRTPVAVINSECEYVLECATSLDDAKESVTSIKRQSDKMSKLISELLTISRMDKENLKINFEDVDVSELLNFVCDEQEEIHDNKTTLHRDISPEVCAKSDQMLIARMFINLISNAYTYGKENGNVWVSLNKNDKNMIFVVRDDGIGISKEELSKIWERFYRVDKSRAKSDNMGLGLSIVKWIVEHHNGMISIESELGVGTEIIVNIPIKQENML